MGIHVTPIPRLTVLTVPAFTLGTANAAGSALTAVASDSTLLAFDTTLPDAITFGQSGAVGSAVVTSRRDHAHAMASGSGVAKAWCSITPAGGLESPDYGVASISDTDTGDRTVNFVTNYFSSTVYAVTGGLHGGVSDGSTFEYNSRARGSVQIVTYNGSNVNADVGGSVAFFGEL